MLGTEYCGLRARGAAWRPVARPGPNCSGLGERGQESAPGASRADGEKGTDSRDT